MARRSTVDDLPQELQDWIMRLREQGRTYDEIVEALRKLDTLAVVPSRSALHRHIQQRERVKEMVQRQRMLAEALVSRDVIDADDSQVVRGNIVMMHALLTRIQTAALEAEDGGEEGPVLSPQEIMQLAKAMDHLAKAAKDDLARTLAIEERATRKARAEAAASADRVAKERGLSAEDIAAIARGILEG